MVAVDESRTTPADPAEKSVKTRSWRVEHTDRSKEVTHLVSVWVVNDGDHFYNARHMIREGGSGALACYLLGVLKSAPEFSAPWQTAQDLAPNDYAHRIDWDAVAAELSD